MPRRRNGLDQSKSLVKQKELLKEEKLIDEEIISKSCYTKKTKKKQMKPQKLVNCLTGKIQ
ncbi:Uncharacterized protein APZ42_004857, partial [Daphnia magna]